jgi:hypothetical protein
MAGPSPYNRKLKAKNDRRKARAAKGGRTPSEAGLAKSMAASGNKVSKSNQRVGAPRTKPNFGTPRSPRKARRSTTRVRTAQPPKLPGILGDAQDAVRDADKAVAGFVRDRLNETPKVDFLPESVERSIDSAVGDGDGQLTTAERLDIAPIGAAAGLTAVKTGAKIAGRVASRKAAKEGGEKTVKKTVRQKAKEAPKKVADSTKKKARRVKDAPGKLKTSEGRREAGKKVGKGVARTPRRNPVLSTGAASVAADEAGVGGEVTRRVADSTKGVIDALNPVNDEGKVDLNLWSGADSKDSPLGRTTETTLRAVPGAIAGLAQVPAAAAETVYRGVRKGAAEAGRATRNPLLENVGKDYTGKEIASPVADTATEMGKGLYEMGKPFVEGDREGVSDVVQNQVGFAPAVFTPRVARTIRRSKPYQGARGKVRDTASKRRDAKQEKARKQKRQDEEQRGQSDVIVPPNRRTDSQSGRGDEYVFQSLGRRIENRRTARKAKRSGELALRPVNREVEAITKDIYRSLVRAGKKPKGMSGNEFKQMLAATLTLAVQQPVTAGRATASLAYLDRMIAKQTGTSDPSVPGAVYDRQVVDFLKSNRELLDDPNFADAVRKAVDATNEGTVRTKGEGGGQRARYEPAADVYGIELPEARVERGVTVGGRTLRFKDVQPTTRERWEAQAKNASIAARKLTKEIDALPVGSPLRAVKINQRDAFRAKGDQLRNKLRDYRAAYAKAESDFVDETRAAIQRDGLDPDNIGYVRDAKRPGPDGLGKAGIENFYRGNVVADQRRSGSLRRKNRADRSGDTFVGQSLMRPRLMEAVNKLSRGFFTQNAVRVQTAKGKSIYATAKEWEAAYARGEVPVGVTLVHSQFVKGAFRGRMAREDARKFDVDENGMPVTYSVGQAGKNITDRNADPGQKYVAVDKKAWDEFMYQVGGPRGGVRRFASRANRFTSTAILGYNPSWAAAQVFAEGLPAFASIGLSPGAWKAVFEGGRAYKRMTPKERADIDAVTGSAGGTLRQFGNIQDRYGELDYDLVRLPPSVKSSKVYEKLTRRRPNSADMDDMVAGVSGRALRELKDAAKGRSLNEFVLWFGGKYRRAVFSAEVSRRQRTTLTSLARATLGMRTIDRQMRKMDSKEAQLYIARNPDKAAELADYMEDVMGNWTALSKTEGALAPFVAFYPYLRYSLRWVFYGFPSRHPIKASILYFMAQQNANQLEKMLGGPPSVFLDYAFPIITVDGEQRDVPGGARFSPALSVLAETVGLDDPARLGGVLNPGIAAIDRARTGTDPFTGEREAYGFLDQTLLGLSALAYMYAPIRWTDSLIDGGKQEGGGTVNRITPRKDWSQGPFSDESVIGGEPSDTSREFRDADSTNQINNLLDILSSRSGGNILRSRSGEEARAIDALRRRMQGEKASSGSSSAPSSKTSTTPWYVEK